MVFEYDYAGRRVSRIHDGLENQRIRYFNRFAETQGGTLTKHIWLGDTLVASDHIDLDLVAGWEDFVLPVEWLAGFGALVTVLLLGAGLQGVRLPPERVLAARAVGAGLLLLTTGPPLLLFATPVHAGGGGAPPPEYLGMRHYHTDHLGSTQVVTDEVGAVLQQIRYDAYGAIRTQQDGAGLDISGLRHDDARRAFTGHEHEHLSKLLYAGARFYDPELGQFLTHDPAGQFASPYAYGPGDPMNGTDPTGALFGITWVMVGVFLKYAALATAAASVGYAFATGGFWSGVQALALVGLGIGLGAAAGGLGGVLGSASPTVASSGLIQAGAGLANNLLVQNTLLATSIGLSISSMALGSSAPEGLAIASYALAGFSLGLAFSNGATSAAANGVQPAGSQGRGGSGPAADPATAAKHVEEASANVIRDLKSGDLRIGLDERTIDGGFDSIRFESVDDLPGVADIGYDVWEGRDGEVFGNVRIGIDRQGAVSLAETYRSIGHELGHLVPQVRALSPIAPPGMPSSFSPLERGAERVGIRVGKHYGF